MSEKIEPGQNKSMTPGNPGSPGGRRGLPTPAFWACLGLVVAGAIYTLACQVDLAGLAILAAGLVPLVIFRNDW